jgi:hypothetical protein
VSSRTVYLTDGHSPQVDNADSATIDNGALVITSGSGEAIFAHRFWTACVSDSAQIVWTPTESPAPAGTRTPTPRFGVIDHGA